MRKFIKQKRAGFTLIELSLSLAFISILSITIVMIINDMILTYQKGLVLKQVNTVGTELVDEFSSAISQSPTNDLKSLCSTLYTSDSSARQSCQDDNAYKFVLAVRTADVKIGSGTKTASSAPVFGAFCSGKYTYIWNSGYFFNSNDYEVADVEMATFSYKKDDGTTAKIENFRLLKVLDPSHSICYTANGYESSNVISNSFETDNVITEEPTDILSGDYSNLALYDLYISKPAQDNQSKNAFYSGSFILATVQGGINIKSSGNYCATPSEYKVENFDYCAINKFNFAKQANGV